MVGSARLLSLRSIVLCPPLVVRRTLLGLEGWPALNQTGPRSSPAPHINEPDIRLHSTHPSCLQLLHTVPAAGDVARTGSTGTGSARHLDTQLRFLLSRATYVIAYQPPYNLQIQSTIANQPRTPYKHTRTNHKTPQHILDSWLSTGLRQAPQGSVRSRTIYKLNKARNAAPNRRPGGPGRPQQRASTLRSHARPSGIWQHI